MKIGVLLKKQADVLIWVKNSLISRELGRVRNTALNTVLMKEYNSIIERNQSC